tara:strand:+ start:700 stop:1191 length:492 start_codon:yes stop_codon:yes gene_type:complete
MEIGYIVGRFQPLHIGHIELINQLILKFDYPIVFIGSANKYNEDKNPYSFFQRKRFIHDIFPDITVLGIDDYNDNELWSSVLHNKIIEHLSLKGIKHTNINFLSSSKGNDHKLRENWTNNYGHHVINIPPLHNISATNVRKYIKNKDPKVYKLIDKKTLGLIY